MSQSIRSNYSYRKGWPLRRESKKKNASKIERKVKDAVDPSDDRRGDQVSRRSENDPSQLRYPESNVLEAIEVTREASNVTKNCVEGIRRHRPYFSEVSDITTNNETTSDGSLMNSDGTENLSSMSVSGFSGEESIEYHTERKTLLCSISRVRSFSPTKMSNRFLSRRRADTAALASCPTSRSPAIEPFPLKPPPSARKEWEMFRRVRSASSCRVADRYGRLHMSTDSLREELLNNVSFDEQLEIKLRRSGCLPFKRASQVFIKLFGDEGGRAVDVDATGWRGVGEGEVLRPAEFTASWSVPSPTSREDRRRKLEDAFNARMHTYTLLQRKPKVVCENKTMPKVPSEMEYTRWPNRFEI